MVDVFLTVDVEVWCDDWSTLDATFADAYRRYVYGPTPRGRFGLPRQLEALNAHGLQAVFFVESLFACRFGTAPLAEIVGLLQDGGQEVQLHLHPEWTQEARQPLVAPFPGRRSGMAQFGLDDQAALVGAAREQLAAAGAAAIDAFRAGSFGFDLDTLAALERHGIGFDSSYNASMTGLGSGLRPGERLAGPVRHGGVWELPMTVFEDGTGRLRHAQLTACSSAELESVLWQAADRGDPAVVLLWHNFELLNPAKTRADPIVVARFDRLCRFLDRHRDAFRVTGFRGLEPRSVEPPPALPRTGFLPTAARIGEQLVRRGFA